MDEREAMRIAERLHVLDGLLLALERRVEISAAVWDAADSDEGLRRLMSEPFSFSETQAQHILDMPLRRSAVAARARLSREAAELRAAQGED